MKVCVYVCVCGHQFERKLEGRREKEREGECHTSVASAFSPLMVSPSRDSNSLKDDAGSMWNMSIMCKHT